MLGSKATEISLEKIERKLKKLQRDPELFFKDFVNNGKQNIVDTLKRNKLIKPKTVNKFTIVSAVYNVSKYLEDYFESIVNQSIDFKNSIYIICVDDGSTDNSADIIKKWQKKYPKNIKYIYKENGGQSSARNVGLESVTTDWVTLIDPDDFLHVDFFKEMDKQLVENKSLKLLIPNFIFYFENQDLKKDTHPLKYRFNKTTIVDSKNLDKNIHLHAASSVFDYRIIKNNNLKFNPEVKPSFEDCKFITDYLLLCLDSKVIFLKSSIYFYRKREDGTSTLDTAWEKPEKYSNVLKFGYLEMLETYQRKLGKVPKHIQRTALYELAWYVNYLLNSEGKSYFLTENEKENFIKLVRLIFSYIDSDTIMDFNLANIWFMKKVGMLGCFKNEKPKFQIAYVENIDRENKQVLVSFFTTLSVNLSYKLNKKDIIPDYFKTTQYDFVGEVFTYEKRAWLTYTDIEDTLEIFIDGESVRISLYGQQFKDGVKIKNIIDRFNFSYKYEADNSWLFIDRNTQADDNAEHLYRYIQKNQLKDDCYFALNRNSRDWERLEKDGFNLIEYGSPQFEERLRKCSKIISSNVDHYISNYFGDDYEYSKKIVFLQHGVIKDDLSNWLNTKKNLQCFITSTLPEYNSIALDNTHYKSTKKEVVLTGLPRHDALISNSTPKEKIILIMPTWRSNIVGKTIGNGNEREINDEFIDTNFAQSWMSLLNDSKFKYLVEKFNYKIVFAPHVNIVPYIHILNIPGYISLWIKESSGISIQDLIVKSEVLITDYSSIAFEMAYLNKSIIYYQFDKEYIYSGGHTYQKGYFDYYENGFGPVVIDVDGVNSNLELILENNGNPLSIYLNRMNETFLFKDGNCCKRVYGAILELDNKISNNIDLAIDFYNLAYNAGDYLLAAERAEKILNYKNISDEFKNIFSNKLSKIYININEIEKLEELLKKYESKDSKLQFLYAKGNYEDVLEAIGYEIKLDDYLALRLASIFNLKDFKCLKFDFSDYIKKNPKISKFHYLLLKSYVSYALGDYKDVLYCIKKLKLILLENDTEFNNIIEAHISLMELTSYKNLNKLNFNLINSLNCNSLEFILEKSKILYQMDAPKVAIQCFKEAEELVGFNSFDRDSMKAYIHCLIIIKKWDDLLNKLPVSIRKYPEEYMFNAYYILTLGYFSKWNDIVEIPKINIYNLSKDMKYYLAKAYYRTGDIENAYVLLERPNSQDSFDYWLLCLEIYMQLEQKDEERLCIKQMFAIFPEKSQDIKDKYTVLNQLLSLC